MKIVVLSDTHLSGKNNELPAGLLEQLKSADMLIHAGDIVECAFLEKLKTLCPQVVAVYGNMDTAQTKKLLAEKEIICVNKFKVGIAHGAGAPDKLIDFLTDAFKNDRVDLIVFGHSHKPFNKKIAGILFFNPGSPTDTVFAPYNSYGIIEITDSISAKIVRI